MNATLNDLLKMAREGMKRRDQKKVFDSGAKELLDIALHPIREAVAVAECSITCSEKSDQRCEAFTEKYPYYAFQREAPAFAVLASCLRFLDPLSRYRELGLERWSDGGPFNAKKLCGLAEYSSPSSNNVVFDEIEAHEAYQAFKDMQMELVDDIKSLLGPIEKYSQVAHSAWKSTQSVIEKYDRTGFKLNGGVSLECEGHSKLLMRVIEMWPGGMDLLKREKPDNIGFWLRGGEEKKIWPQWLSDRYVWTRVGMTAQWVPVDQLKDFVAGK